MASRVQIRDRDRGYKALKKRVRRLAQRRKTVDVGVLGEAAAAKHGENLTLVDVASIQEFGLGNSPERSFIRAWFDGATKDNRAAIRAVSKRVAEGKMTERQALELLGVKFQADVQRRISRGIPPPNSPVTIDRKGSAIPLIDKGQLLQGITYRVAL